MEAETLSALCGPGAKTRHPKSRCAQLAKLTLHVAKIRDLTWMPEDPAFTWMDLRQNMIQEIGPLDRSRHLTHLFLSRNAISSLDPLRALGSIEFIQLNENRNLSDLSPLSAMTKLRYIQSNGCSIADLSPIRGLRSLVELTLRENEIVSLEPLSQLENLQIADFSNNEVTNLKGIGPLKKLGVLVLDNNPGVSSIEEVAGLEGLIDFRADNCQITNVDALLGLVRSGKLRGIHLKGNPAALCDHSSMKKLLALRKGPSFSGFLRINSDCE